MLSGLIIFPCNGNGIEAMDCIDPAFYDFAGFADDNFETKQGTAITSNAWISDRVCILPNSMVHHDTRKGDYALINKISIHG